MLFSNVTMKKRKPLSQEKPLKWFHSPKHRDYFRNEDVAQTEPSEFSHLSIVNYTWK